MEIRNGLLYLHPQTTTMEKRYTLYRVEHAKHRVTDSVIHIGCYSTEFEGGDEMLEEHLDDDIWPGMRTDFPMYSSTDNTQDWYCAFDSLERLREWFGDWVDIMLNDGFVVREYVVSLMVTGRSYKQVFFKCDSVIEKKIVEPLESLEISI